MFQVYFDLEQYKMNGDRTTHKFLICNNIKVLCIFNKVAWKVEMNKNTQSVLLLSLVVFYLVNAIPQNSDESNKKSLSLFDKAIDDTILATSSENQMPSQILSTCLCVPYYRCDPGHWEKTEHDHCTRFMYVCCYGSEAVEYANEDQE